MFMSHLQGPPLPFSLVTCKVQIPYLEARKDVCQTHWCQTAQSAFRAGSRAECASPRSRWDQVRKGRGWRIRDRPVTLPMMQARLS